ncbi:hypothetical protein OG21DRAFT_495605 [Imleria badia]|nr:hypothetical protein OG21DRAFT_495605 [Imleria badia]
MSSDGGIGPDGKVYCKHMEEAAKRKSNTSKHPNREFYCCKRRQSDSSKCDFWYWADQLPRAKDGIVYASNSSAAQSPAPRPSKQGGTRAYPPATPPAHPPRKHLSPLNNPSETPRSTKRLEDIEAGLRKREQEQDRSPTRRPGLSKEQGPTTSLSGVQAIPQPPSPVPTEIDCEVETEPRKTFSFLGLDRSPESVAAPLKQEGQPSTPKKRRLTPPTEGIVIQPAAGAGSFSGRLPVTPPSTTRRGAQTAEPESVSAIIRSRKGKEREGVPPVRTQNEWGRTRGGFSTAFYASRRHNFDLQRE